MSDQDDHGADRAPDAERGDAPAVAGHDGAATPGLDEEEFDLEGLVSLSFNPLKTAIRKLMARMDRQDDAVRDLAVAEHGRVGADGADAADRLGAIEKMLGIGQDGTGAGGEDGDDASVADRLAAIERHLGIGPGAAAGGGGGDKLAALERRVTALEDGGAAAGFGGDSAIVESKSSEDGADGAGAGGEVDGIDGSGGEGGKGAVDGADGSGGEGGEGGVETAGGSGGEDGPGGDASGGDGASGSGGADGRDGESGTVGEQLASLRERLGALAAASGDASASGAVAELERRASDAERRLDELEKGLERAQKAADAARRAAATAGSGRGRGSSAQDGDDDDDSALRDAVRSMGERTESVADDDVEKGRGAADGSVGRLRSRGSRASGLRALSRPVSPAKLSDSSRPRTAGAEGGADRASAVVDLDGLLSPGRGASMPAVAGGREGATKEEAEALRGSVAELRSELDALRVTAESNTEAIRRAEAEAEAAREAAKERASALAERRKEAGPGAAGGASADELAAALAAVDDVSSAQRRMQGELERLGKAAARAAETADEAAAAARAAKRSVAEASVAGAGGADGGEPGGDEPKATGAGGGAGMDAATARALAASASTSLGTLTGLARASAGVSGLAPDRVDELAGPADAAIETLRLAAARLEEASMAGGGGGAGEASRAAVEAVGAASAEVGSALDRLLEETAPHAQCKAPQSDVAALRGTVGHVEAELGRAHGSVRDLRQRTEEQVAALLTGGAGGSGAATGSFGGGGAGGSEADEVSDEELAALWEALAQKADVSEVRGLAPLDALRSKADRRELARLKGLLDKLWRHVEAQGAAAPATGDFAFLSGKPLKDYKCLSCGTKLDGMVEPPKFHVPTAAMPPSTMRRRSPQPPSRAGSPGPPSQSVVLPNGTVVHRPTGVPAGLGGSGAGASASRAGDDADRRTHSGAGRRPTSSARKTVRRQSEAATAGGDKADTSLPPIA